MIVEYTGRQFVVTEKYRVVADAALERIGRLMGGAVSAHVILTVDKYRKIAEVTVMNGTQTVAVCEASEMMTALHNALEKIERQAVRHRQRTTTGIRHPRVPGLRSGADAGAVGAA